MNGRRWCYGLAVLLGLCAPVGWTAYQTRSQDPIRYDGLDAIENGMTLAEVEDCLGCSSGDYRTIDVEIAEVWEWRCYGRERARYWHGNRGIIVVWFNPSRVIRKEWRVGTSGIALWWQRCKNKVDFARW